MAALGADAGIVICGRVADASPVISLAAWWQEWADHDFDRLAAALIAGRERCSPLRIQDAYTC